MFEVLEHAAIVLAQAKQASKGTQTEQAPAAEPPAPPAKSLARPGMVFPVYPAESRKLGESGVVVVRVLIAASGKVADAKVSRSSGYPRLDEAALTAARTAQFRPYMENGVPRAVQADLPFNFVLD